MIRPQSLRAAGETVEGWRQRPESLVSDWRQVDAAGRGHEKAVVKRWTSRLEQLKTTQRDLVKRKRWLGGPRTLLVAIDLQYRELAMTASLP